jgi:hypothetical protein
MFDPQKAKPHAYVPNQLSISFIFDKINACSTGIDKEKEKKLNGTIRLLKERVKEK